MAVQPRRKKGPGRKREGTPHTYRSRTRKIRRYQRIHEHTQAGTTNRHIHTPQEPRKNEEPETDSKVLDLWMVDWTTPYHKWRKYSNTDTLACCLHPPIQEADDRGYGRCRQWSASIFPGNFQKEENNVLLPHNQTCSHIPYSDETLSMGVRRGTRRHDPLLEQRNFSIQGRAVEETSLKHALWNIFFTVVVTYIEDSPRWLRTTRTGNVSPEGVIYCTSMFILQHFVPMIWIYSTAMQWINRKNSAWTHASPGGPGEQGYEPMPQERPILLTEALKKYIRPNYSLTVSALQANFHICRRGKLWEIKQGEQWRNLTDEDLIYIPRGGSVVAQTLLHSPFSGISTLSNEQEEDIWTELQEGLKPRWTKDVKRGVLFHRVDQKHNGIGEMFLCKGLGYASNWTQMTLIEEMLRGRGTQRQEPLGCVREAFNFATNKKTDQQEWMAEAEYRKEHATPEGKYSLDLLTLMCHKYGLRITETEAEEAIGCIQIGHCYDSKYDRLYPHAWAFTKLRGQWYLGDKMEATNIVRRVKDTSIPEPWIHLGQSPRFRLWQSRVIQVDIP